MAAQPEEAAQTAGLKQPRLGGKNLAATELKRNQGNDELPCLSNSAPWKERFYEKVHQRCLRLQETKVKMIHSQKAKEENVEKREPCDWLFKEWFSGDKETLDTRIYLLDKLLPTLIPGMEKLLMEVERKNVLTPDKKSAKFNPIIFLGEYLMRHNPRYSISTKPGPYLRGMKMVTEELKTEMPGTTSERLARMRAEAKNKRKEREQVDNMKSQLKEMRKEALAIQFKQWTVDVSGRIPVALVQSALGSFPDVIASIPTDVRKAICDKKLEIVDTLEKKINTEEFAEYVHSYTEHFSHEMFQEILKHLHRCAGDFQEAVKHDMWRQMFTDLFLDCDYGKVGLLDRQKILALLVDFYERSPVIAKRGFCNPRQWPIIELQEIELMDLWGGLDDQEVCEELREKLVLSQTGISEGEILACGPVDDNKQGTSRVKTSVREGLFVQMGMSEAEAGGTSKEENQAAESSDAEVRKEGEDVASAVKSTDFAASDLDGSTIDSEKSSFREAIKMERQTESASADRQEEAFPGSAPTGYSLSRDGEPRSEKQVEEEQFSLGREPDTETDREEDYSVWDKESGSEGQVSQEGDNWTAEATNTISGPTPEAITVTSEARAVADMDVTASEQDAPLAEVVKETPARTESFSRQQGSPFGQQTSSETRLQDEDLLQDQGKGDLLTCDLSCRYRSSEERIPEDWMCENTRFPDLHPIMADIQNLWASHTRSAFDESCLNLPQFVQLMETFVGEDTSLPTVERLIAFIKEEYKQTEEEKMEQLEKGHRISHLAQRKLLLEALFTKWDKNASGFLDLEEVDAILSSFNEGMEKEALMKAKKHLCCRYPQLSRVGKLSPKAFQAFLELVASEFPDDEDKTIDDLVEFLTTSVERSHMECLQSLARRKWLHSIQQAAETSGASMEQLYKAVFKALSQDAEAHGDNKKISAYIALLEENQLSPERGQILLHYVACTADDAPYVLNQILYRDMKGVSFAAVDEGKPIHVPRVELHGNIHFWNYDRPVEERKGSLLVLPLHNARWKVFGILGLDTLRDQCEKTIFLTHEISFYQGVSHAFSKAYHSICTLENVLQMTVTALDWLYPRAPSIHAVVMYLVEPGKDKIRDYALRKMITIDKTGQKEIHSSPVVLLRKENLLRDYLFKCIESSEIIHTSVCGVCHTAVPLRDLSGQALGVFDISIGHHQKLPPQEHKDLQRMLKMAQAACSEILKKSLEEAEPTYGLEAECVADLRHAGILFHQFMLQDLRECVQKLDAESFAEIKSYVEPPALVHSIVKAVLLLLHPNWKDSETTENWSQCKLKLDDNLIQEIYCFDPTSASVQVQAELLLDCITGVPQAAVWQHGSVPAEYLYHWVHTCLALAEITKSLHSKTTHLQPLFGTKF
ncbi:EF-hand calcium-binding domain-containing protein 5 [Athene cunicularia]|uniref:EF-hand calcium-binding domain-containing protein 5 n=1 Tax=Athene cunicularia TaxID=194338 RepID=UPI000EF6F47D|nr:EF-hand calcium-binding domain-containing protein 5 [Athene cunicularia]